MKIKANPYLVWGSFHGIYGIELSPDGLHTKGDKFHLGGNAYEASLIYKRGGYYYFFGSTGSCCAGATSTYQVNVTRATAFKGPVYRQAGQEPFTKRRNRYSPEKYRRAGLCRSWPNGDIIEDKAGQPGCCTMPSKEKT
jgi:arabinan endo-1,5-alpha-L-arabinosidase